MIFLVCLLLCWCRLVYWRLQTHFSLSISDVKVSQDWHLFYVISFLPSMIVKSLSSCRKYLSSSSLFNPRKPLGRKLCPSVAYQSAHWCNLIRAKMSRNFTHTEKSDALKTIFVRQLNISTLILKLLCTLWV